MSKNAFTVGTNLLHTILFVRGNHVRLLLKEPLQHTIIVLQFLGGIYYYNAMIGADLPWKPQIFGVTFLSWCCVGINYCNIAPFFNIFIVCNMFAPPPIVNNHILFRKLQQSTKQKFVQGKCSLHFVNFSGAICSNTLFSNTFVLAIVATALSFRAVLHAKVREHLGLLNTSTFPFRGSLARRKTFVGWHSAAFQLYTVK